jgi:hypothetical protein
MSADGLLQPSNQQCTQNYVYNVLMFPELCPVCINTVMYSSNTNRYMCITDLACQIEQCQLAPVKPRRAAGFDRCQWLCVQFELLMMGGGTA